MESRKVAILGAGPAGMTLAVLLARKGYNIEVFEKRFDPLSGNQNTDGRSFNLGLTVRGVKGFRELGLDQEILGQTVPVKDVCVHQPNGDQVIIPMGGYQLFSEQGHPSVKRQWIQEVLARKMKTLSNIEIHYESIVSDVNLKEGTFSFTHNGQKHERGGYVQIFATDGVYSSVQKALHHKIGYDYSLNFNEYGYIETTIPKEKIEQYKIQNNQQHHWIGPGDFFIITAPNIEGDFMVAFFFKRVGPNSFEHFGKDFKGFKDLITNTYKEFEDLVPDMENIFLNQRPTQLATLKCYPWSHGNFLLVGDSCHAMSPILGQGCNIGIEDAIILDQIETELNGDWTKIPKKFQEVRKPNTDAVCDMAEAFAGHIFMPFDETFHHFQAVQRYLVDVYQHVGSLNLLYFTHDDQKKAFDLFEAERFLIHELVETIDDLKELIAEKKHDQRVVNILQRLKNGEFVDPMKMKGPPPPRNQGPPGKDGHHGPPPRHGGPPPHGHQGPPPHHQGPPPQHQGPPPQHIDGQSPPPKQHL